MAKIKDRNTSPEIIVKKCLRRLQYKYRSNVKDYTGKPDILLLDRKKIIFVNGCFWHGHKGCSRASIPKTNKIFWQNKIQSNINRDKKVKRELVNKGFKVLVVWQCQTKDIKKLEIKLRNFIEE